jgi:hypothetical protein
LACGDFLTAATQKQAQPPIFLKKISYPPLKRGIAQIFYSMQTIENFRCFLCPPIVTKKIAMKHTQLHTSAAPFLAGSGRALFAHPPTLLGDLTGSLFSGVKNYIHELSQVKTAHLGTIPALT